MNNIKILLNSSSSEIQNKVDLNNYLKAVSSVAKSMDSSKEVNNLWNIILIIVYKCRLEEYWARRI